MAEDFDSRSLIVAKNALAQFNQEADILEYLLEAKPKFLGARDLTVMADLDTLRKKYKGIAEKLCIHGYSDRSERLMYLFECICNKLSNKIDALKSSLIFMLEMSERPTSLLNLQVDSVSYTSGGQCDGDNVDLELIDLLLDDSANEGRQISYSSESDLSNWSSDDEEHNLTKDERSIEDLRKFVPPIRQYNSFSDFTTVEDIEEARQSMEIYRRLEGIKAEEFLRDGYKKKSSFIPLNHQPVISGLLTFQAKFGEFWEWKHKVKKSEVFLIHENDVIREILNLLMLLDPEVSALFFPNWELRPNVMIRSVSQTPFLSILSKFQRCLYHLAKLKGFAVEHTHSESDGSLLIRCFCLALSEYISFVAVKSSNLQRMIFEKTSMKNEIHHPTILQMLYKLEDQLQCVDTVYQLYHNSFGNEDSTNASQFLQSYSLLHHLANYINYEKHIRLTYNIITYIFICVFQGFLTEINFVIRTLDIESDHPIFEKNSDVNISSSNFWTDVIKLRDDYLHSAPQPFREFAKQVLNVLKTCCMLEKLNEDFSPIVGDIPSPQLVLHDYVTSLFGDIAPLITHEQTTTEVIQYTDHFQTVGLQNSFVEASFSSIIECPVQSSEKRAEGKQFTLDDFLSIDNVPIISPFEILRTVLSRWYKPMLLRATTTLSRMFQDYSIEESLGVFREIVLGTREDFARSVSQIAIPMKCSNLYTYEDEYNRDPAFQKLLNDCYPDRGHNFTISLRLDSARTTNYTYKVQILFPLSLILLENSVDSYMFVSEQLHRIRKSLWDTTNLRIKDLSKSTHDNLPRLMLFRFAFIHFCSSLRAFLVFTIFGRHTTTETMQSAEMDVDAIRNAQWTHLNTIECKILKNSVMENVILRKMSTISETLQRGWKIGLSDRTLTLLEDTLKKCWTYILGFEKIDNIDSQCT